MKTAYATIKGTEVMRALRKGQAASFYYGGASGEQGFRPLSFFEGEIIDPDPYLQQC
jgi:hypothetical protein